jgi:hypothetical protein
MPGIDFLTFKNTCPFQAQHLPDLLAHSGYLEQAKI